MNKILNIVTVGEFIAQIVTDSTRCVLRSPHICTMRNGYAPESIKIPLFMAYPYHMPYHRALGLAMDWAYICRVYFVIWSLIMCGTLLVLLFIRERVSCVSEARVWSDRYIQASCVCVCVCVSHACGVMQRKRLNKSLRSRRFSDCRPKTPMFKKIRFCN